MLSEEVTSNFLISLNEKVPKSISEFMKPFVNFDVSSIHKGMHLNFEIIDRPKTKKKCPILRIATPDDAFDIVEIYRELYDNTYPYKEMLNIQEVKKMIRSPDCDWIIFDINGKTIGCFTFMLDFEDKKGYIRGLMIKKKFQGIVDVKKAVIGSFIGMYSKYKNRIFRWYCENRTAHHKSQYVCMICGIRPVAFYPNKDVFLGNVESDILHICYDERAITNMRSKKIPRIISEVKSSFIFSDGLYLLGPCKIVNSNKLSMKSHKISQLRKNLKIKITKDKFGYETIRYIYERSSSFFEFLYTPQIQNFEKTHYKIDSLEQLYVFVEKFIEHGKMLNVRYLEVFVSAYEPDHQKIFFKLGLEPRGYLPSWKYNKNTRLFEDYILFNSFSGDLNNDIQLIDEGKRLLKVLGFKYTFSHP